MKPYLFTLIFVVFAPYSIAVACSLPPGFKPPTLMATKDRAKSIFRGKVTEVSDAREANHLGRKKIKLKVAIMYKGDKATEKTVYAGADMCDSLGMEAKLGEDCLIFVDSKDDTLSGQFAAFASECGTKENAKTFEANVAKKMIDLGL